MIARTAAAIASFGLAIGSIACMGFYEIPIETPIQAKLDVTAFQRVLIVGFLAGGSKSVDPNTELIVGPAVGTTVMAAGRTYRSFGVVTASATGVGCETGLASKTVKRYPLVK